MHKIGIVVFPNVEELDFIGPFETLSYINKLKPDAAQVLLLAVKQKTVRAFNGLSFQVDFLLDEAPQLDVIVIPGGFGRHQAMLDLDIRRFIQSQATQVKFICSVCTGAFILAEAGLLHDLQATTHYTALAEFKTRYPDVNVKSARVIDNGKILLSAGISSGIDLSLLLIKKLYGITLAQEIARRLEYSPLIKL